MFLFLIFYFFLIKCLTNVIVMFSWIFYGNLKDLGPYFSYVHDLELKQRKYSITTLGVVRSNTLHTTTMENGYCQQYKIFSPEKKRWNRRANIIKPTIKASVNLKFWSTYGWWIYHKPMAIFLWIFFHRFYVYCIAHL